MSGNDGSGRIVRLRAIADEAARRVGGVPAVRTLTAIFEAYDDGGGGLVAAGLAYAALFALLPGLLLILSVFGLVVTDPMVQERLVAAIATAIPPLADFAQTALHQVSAGAVPGGIIALVGLVWAASRFYAALDYAISRIFRRAKPRNEIVRTVRGIVLTLVLVALPIVAVLAGLALDWLLSLLPDRQARTGLENVILQLMTPVGTVVLFLVATIMIYRNVPAQRVPAAAWRRPAIVVGLVLTVFTQLFALIAPMMTRISALYGTIVVVFALLVWLSIGFNLVLMGAAWTRVRLVALSTAEAEDADG